MKVQHDREADALYIEFSEVRPLHGIDVPGLEGVSEDIDENGRLIGIEILDASRRLGGGLSKLSFEDLVSEQTSTLALPDYAAKRKTASRKAS
jgi:uncharacterized protein YuzE